MKHLLVASLAFAAGMPAAAQAVTVYPGCAVPSLKPSHHTFFIDPVKGSPSGDGSAAKPWRTLAEVLDTNNKLLSTMGHNGRTFRNGDTSFIPVNPSGPIKPGDVLMLKSGNHGDVRTLNSFNSDFITIMAAPGETPVISSLTIISSGKWLFQGLKIMGMNPTPPSTSALVSLARGDWLGMTTDIIIDSNKISSTDNTANWTAADWDSKPDSYLVLMGQNSTCLSVTNNAMTNGSDAVALGSDNSVLQGNVITRMRYDGVDIFGSNQIIRGNTIKDGTNDATKSALHPDGIQGWSVKINGVEKVNKNVVIDSNTVIKTGNPDKTQMQGISIFDGKWEKLSIVNNVVVTNVWNGLVVSGGKDVMIANNTVLASDANHSTWIFAAKENGTIPGQNVTVRNNIASNLVIGHPSVAYDHNVVASMVQLRDASNKLTIINKGAFGNSNKVNPAIQNGFVSNSKDGDQYDLRLRPTSVAIAAGTSLMAPTYDILNRKRSTPFDIGAYQH